jgi:hypothetical protein
LGGLAVSGSCLLQTRAIGRLLVSYHRSSPPDQHQTLHLLLQAMSAWERAQTAAEEAELRAAIEASLLDAAPAGDVAKATVPKSPARAKVGPSSFTAELEFTLCIAAICMSHSAESAALFAQFAQD